MFKIGWNSVQDKDRPDRLPMACTPEMVYSLNAVILVDGRVTIEDILEQLGIPVGTAHKIVHDDLALSGVSCCSISPDQCSKNCQFSWE